MLSSQRNKCWKWWISQLAWFDHYANVYMHGNIKWYPINIYNYASIINMPLIFKKEEGERGSGQTEQWLNHAISTTISTWSSRFLSLLPPVSLSPSWTELITYTQGLGYHLVRSWRLLKSCSLLQRETWFIKTKPVLNKSLHCITWEETAVDSALFVALPIKALDIRLPWREPHHHELWNWWNWVHSSAAPPCRPSHSWAPPSAWENFNPGGNVEPLY